MNLKTYLEETGQSIHAFSKLCERTSYATLWRICNGKTNATAEHAAEIEQLTGGRVSRESTLYPNEHSTKTDSNITNIIKLARKIFHIGKST